MTKKVKGSKLSGLGVKVYNNNVEKALRKFKRIVKDSELMLQLKKKSYYKKKSELKRERINLAKSRQRYKDKEVKYPTEQG